MRRPSRRAAIGRTAVVAVVIIILVIGAAAGIYYATQGSKSTSNTSSSSTTSTGNSSSTGTSSTSGTSGGPSTLVMDDANYPINGVNVLTFVSEVPWPDWFGYSVYQPLVTVNVTSEYNSGIVQYVPTLANNWTVSSDNMTYTFNLRQNVTFSNGDPFNAYQVWGELYGFYYLSGNSSGWWQSYPVFDMTNVNFGPSTLELMNSTKTQMVSPNSQMLSIMENKSWPIYVTGPNTIVFHLKSPFLFFLGTFVSYVGMTFDTQYVLNNGGFGSAGTPNPTFETTPIPGTGPYTITGVAPNAHVDFSQNPTYWGANLTAAQIKANPYLDPGHVKNVVVNYTPDDLTRYTDVSTGQAQVAAIFSPSEWQQVQSNPSKFGYTVLPSWSADISAIALNTNAYPTNVTAVRQAIAQAINYTAIDQEAFYGQITPGVGPEYPLYTQYYDLGNHSSYQYDPTNATKILTTAGINPSSLPTLTFTVVQSCTFCLTIAQIVQQNLQAIGLKVSIVQQASTAYFANYGSYSTNVANAAQIGQLSILGGSTWAPSALTAADNWVSFVNNGSSWGNWAGYSNPTVQTCVNALTSSGSQSTITADCTAAQSQIYNDAPYIWLGFAKLWYYSGSLVYQKSVIKSYYLDPSWSGIDTMPIINTVQFNS